MFLEAKDKVRLEEKHEENLERIWRARQGFLHKRLDMGMKDVSIYVSMQLYSTACCLCCEVSHLETTA